MKKIILFTISLLAMVQWSYGQMPPPPGTPDGSGTEEEPYLIETLDHLKWISEHSSEWDQYKYFKQTADIDATETSTWNNGAGFVPIGNSTYKFNGTYDGDGHTIDALCIDNSSSSYLGLFAYITSNNISANPNVSNLGLTNVSVTGSSVVGAIAGKIEGGANINNCYSTGLINGYGYLGGLVGWSIGSYTTISRSHSSCSVTSTGGDNIGGLVGYNNDAATILSSYSTGNVSGADESAGGLVGYNYKNNAWIYDCYSTGAVSGNYYAGGLVGECNSAKVQKCYSTGNVSGNTSGGFLGYVVNSTISSNYWNTTTCSNKANGVGYPTSQTGVTGKTTGELQTLSTFIGWDFDSRWAMSANYNNGYPNLDKIEGWTGSVSTDWNTAGNWGDGCVPDETDNITIPNFGSKYINNYPVISGTADCNDLTVENGASLTINSGASFITNGAITNNGTIQIKRNITANKWHFISSPITDATAGVFNGNYLQHWDETTALWSDVAAATLPLNPAKGFSLWSDAGGNFVFTGTPNTGEVSLDYGGGKGPAFYDYMLLGNPYPSSIDWSMLDDSYGAVYYWDQDNSRYASWNDGSGNNGGVQYVMPCQGFFIAYADNGSGTFTVNNTCRTHEGSTFFKGAPNLTAHSIRLQSSGNNYNDESLIVFDELADADFQLKYDAVDMKSGINGMPELYSCYGDNSFSIDVRPKQNEIQLGFSCNVSGDYTISLKESSDFSTIVLWDTKEDVKTDLLANAYTFNWEAGEEAERFKLLLGTTAIDDLQETTAWAYRSANQIVAQSGRPIKRLILRDITGKKLGVYKNTQNIPAPKTAGVYLVTIETDNQRITNKITIP